MGDHLHVYPWRQVSPEEERRCSESQGMSDPTWTSWLEESFVLWPKPDPFLCHLSFWFPLQQLSFSVYNLIIFTKTIIIFDPLIYLFYLHLLFTQLLHSARQNLSYLCDLNWISTKDQLQWSECPSKNVCLLFHLEKNKHNIFQRKFLFLGKLPRLLSLCWVVLMGTSQYTQWSWINIMWQWLLSTKLLCNR